MSPITTKKYLRVAFIDGVATTSISGSCAGAFGSGISACAVWYQAMPAIPASSRMMLAIDHIAAVVVSSLPTSGSCGQLLVYDSPVSPGRSVVADQADQKKNPASALRSSARGSAFVVMAYCSRKVSSAAASPKSAV